MEDLFGNLRRMTLKESLELKMEAENGEWGENELLELMCRYQRYHSIVEEQAYVIRGSVLSCEYGTKEVRIDCTEDHGVYVGTAPLMTCGDCQHTNIHEFGSCMCPESNYAGRLPMPPGFFMDLSRAEKAPGNNLAHVCRPLINLEQGWRQIDEDLLVESQAHMTEPALLSSAVLVCNYGGIIRVREVPEKEEALVVAPENPRHVVWCEALNLREEPSSTSEKLGEYSATTRVNVLQIITNENGEEWAKVDYNGCELWCSYQYLLPDEDIITTADMFPKEMIVEINKEGDLDEWEDRAVNDRHIVQDNWGMAGKYPPKYKLFRQIEGKNYYNIAVGPRVLNPKYPDDGNLAFFEAFSRFIDVEIENIETGDKRILNCYRADLKAHTYNYYPDGHKFGAESGIEVTVLDENGERIKNGFLQTGIRYPKVTRDNETVDDNEEWEAYTTSGNIIEFVSAHTGDLDCRKYRLVSITVYLKEEKEDI